VTNDQPQTTPGRIRKAWYCWVRGYDAPDIFFAPTAGNARVQAWRILSNVSDVRIVDVTARRAPERDVILPARDPRADALTKDERHCLLHAFGGDDPMKAGKRDYFYTRRDDPPLVALASHGLMHPLDGDKWGDGMTYFVLTDAGKHVALSMMPEYRA